MKTKKNEYRSECNEKKERKDHKKRCEPVEKDRQYTLREPQRQDKRILKKRVVKILTKKGQVSFDKLVRKLDVKPSLLSKVLAKLEGKGLVSQVATGTGEADRGQGRHHHGQGHRHEGGRHHAARHHCEAGHHCHGEGHETGKHSDRGRGRQCDHRQSRVPYGGASTFALSAGL